MTAYCNIDDVKTINRGQAQDSNITLSNIEFASLMVEDYTNKIFDKQFFSKTFKNILSKRFYLNNPIISLTSITEGNEYKVGSREIVSLGNAVGDLEISGYWGYTNTPERVVKATTIIALMLSANNNKFFEMTDIKRNKTGINEVEYFANNQKGSLPYGSKILLNPYVDSFLSVC